MVKMCVSVKNPSGLHARPASKLCAIARSYKCNSSINCGEFNIDIKKILDLMSANLRNGDELEVICDGIDEKQAIKEIVEFIQNLDE